MATIITLIQMTQRPKRDGTYPIYIRSIKNRKASYVSTNYSIPQKDWDEKKGKVKSSYPNSARLNAQLRHIEDEYSKKVLGLEESELDISLKSIKKKLLGEDSANFCNVAREIAHSYKINGKIGTSAKVKSIINKLIAYMHSEAFTFKDIDIKLLTNYQTYLIEKLKNKSTTVNKDLKFIRTVFLYAQRMDYIEITTNPFPKFKFLKENTERGFLLPEEIKVIEECDCSNIPYIKRAKDIILFQYHSGGIRISDVLLMKWKNIIDGRVHLTIRKTGKQASHKLSLKALAIIEKYKPLETEYIFGYLKNGFDLTDLVSLYNSISSCTTLINKALKKIAQICDIDKRLSTHLFRHSFATNALKQGMSLEVLQSILKHSNIRETQIYAKVLNSTVDAEMDKLNL